MSDEEIQNAEARRKEVLRLKAATQERFEREMAEIEEELRDIEGYVRFHKKLTTASSGTGTASTPDFVGRVRTNDSISSVVSVQVKERLAVTERSSVAEVVAAAKICLENAPRHVRLDQLTVQLTARGLKLGLTEEERKRRVTSVLSANSRDFDGIRGQGWMLKKNVTRVTQQQFPALNN